jgi:hypothetical protein
VRPIRSLPMQLLNVSPFGSRGAGVGREEGGGGRSKLYVAQKAAASERERERESESDMSFGVGAWLTNLARTPLEIAPRAKQWNKLRCLHGTGTYIGGKELDQNR